MRLRQWEEAGARGADPDFGLCYLDADGGAHRELPSVWPGLLPETFLPGQGVPLGQESEAPAWPVVVGDRVGACRVRVLA